MSRADQLARYLDKGTNKKKKKKPKSSSSIVIEGTASSISQHVSEPEISDDDQSVVVDDHQKSSTKFKGFKRIDGKELIEVKDKDSPTEDISKVTINQPSTVYRNKTGRIIDIETKTKELRAEKEAKVAEEALKQKLLKETELSRLEKNELDDKLKNTTTFTVSKSDTRVATSLKQKQHFDDPLNVFDMKNNTKTDSNNFSKTGKPLYNKGISLGNRFGIKAGYFWDGIDRSNGFEELVIRKRNEQSFMKKDRQTYEMDLDL